MFKINNLSKLLILVIVIVAIFFPYNKKFLGVVQQNRQKSITVVGEASKVTKNQVASFSAGVSVVKDNKDEAVKEVNEKVAKIISDVKAFGVNSADVKTQNLSIYQREESYYEDGKQKSRLGQWSVSNTVDIKLRNVDKASDLATLLATSGANNVWGPNFEMDDITAFESELLSRALENAKIKATSLVSKSGGEIGQIISITEGVSVNPNQPLFDARGMGGGGGAPVEQGSTKITKTVTVSFEIH